MKWYVAGEAMQSRALNCGYIDAVSYTHLDVYKRQLEDMVRLLEERI